MMVAAGVLATIQLLVAQKLGVLADVIDQIWVWQILVNDIIQHPRPFV